MKQNSVAEQKSNSPPVESLCKKAGFIRSHLWRLFGNTLYTSHLRIWLPLGNSYGI